MFSLSSSLLSKHFFDIINFRNLKNNLNGSTWCSTKKNSINRRKKNFVHFLDLKKFDWQKKNLTFAELLNWPIFYIKIEKIALNVWYGKEKFSSLQHSNLHV